MFFGEDLEEGFSLYKVMFIIMIMMHISSCNKANQEILITFIMSQL